MKVRLEKAQYGGSFEGKAEDGTPVAVSFGLPGEFVETTEAHPPAEPELMHILEPSPNRVSPQCIHFGTCGGCQYQHADSPAQLALKTVILKDLLAEIPGIPEPKLHTAAPWGYRNRIRLRVETFEGTIRVGYSRRNSNHFLPICMCPIAAPLLWRAAEAMTHLAAEDPICRRWFAVTSEIELFATTGLGTEDSKLQINLYLRDSDQVRHRPDRPNTFPTFCERLKATIPELTGAAATMDPELSRRTRRLWDGATWGAAGLLYEAAGARYWVSRGAFFQVNRHLVDTLVDLVTAGRKGRLAWDLFAGVGLFSRALAETFAEVVSVEGGAIAAKDLEQMEKTAKTTGRIRAVHAPTLEFLRAQSLQRTRPDLIVMDPPRAGVGEEGCRVLGRMRVPELVYVSCDPVTLARDLKILTGAGYEIAYLHLVDLFPQTFHMETITILRHPG